MKETQENSKLKKKFDVLIKCFMKYEELKVGKKCVDKFFDYVNHK